MDKKKLSSIKGEELETLQEILEKLQKIAKSNGNVLLMSDLSEAIAQFDLTDEERERICNLEFSLKAPLNNDCEAVKRLNGECEYLIKKMTEYGVSV